MESINLKRISLSYTICNISSLICVVIIVPVMMVTIFLTKIFVISDINKILRQCSPISYYFGETVGCKKLIYDHAERENFESNIKTIPTKMGFINLFESSSNTIVNFTENLKKVIYQYLVKIFI